jgi:hypothetical protein
MNVADVALYALDHPTLTAAAMSFLGGVTLGFVFGRFSRRQRVPDIARRVDPRF